MKKPNNFQIAKVQPQGLISFCLVFFANFSLALLIKVLVMKKHVYLNDVDAKTSLITLNTSSAT